MKKIIACLSLALLSIQVNAQAKPKTMDLGNIVSAPASLNDDMGSKLGLQPIKDSKSVIEIRLYSNLGFPGTQCIVLQYDKGWKAMKVKLNAKDSVLRSSLKPVAGIDNVVRSIIASNVFSLPAQSAINTGNYKLDLLTNEVKPSAMTISDGACYHIQFKVSDQSREYKYCDPKSYAVFYKGQHEYTDFVNILKAFARLEAK